MIYKSIVKYDLCPDFVLIEMWFALIVLIHQTNIDFLTIINDPKLLAVFI